MGVLNEKWCKMYTECISTLSHNRDSFMMWHPLSLDIFLEQIGI